MVALIPALLLASTASAQITTSLWTLNVNLGTDKVGYVGSVIAVDGTHTTLAINYDNGTDTSALDFGALEGQTMTIGPEFFGQDTEFLRLECERVNGEGDGACTYFLSETERALAQCRTDIPTSGYTYVQTVSHSYPARLDYEAGEETIAQTYSFDPATSTRPAWCNEDPNNIPASALQIHIEIPASDFDDYQLVITAGMEKLDATEGSGPTVASATSTNTGYDNAVSPTTADSTGPAEFTGAAGEMKAGGHLMVGLGAAAAAFFV